MNAKLRIKLLPILVFRKKSLHLPIESPFLPCSAPHSLFLSAEQRQNSQLLKSHSLEKKNMKRIYPVFSALNLFLRPLKMLFHTPETLKNSEFAPEKPRKYTGSPYFLTPLRNLWFLLGAIRVVI